MAKNKRKNGKRKRASSGKKGMPSTAELVAGCRSPVAMAAIFRSGAGQHADGRRKRARDRKAWKRDHSAASA